MPVNRTDSPGACSPTRPGWNRPTTPWRSSPVRTRMNLVLPSSTGTLSDGISGMPRQVMNCAPNRLTTTGGTPRWVASRPNAAIPSGWVRKKLGVFQTLVISASRSSGVGAPAERLDCLLRSRLREQPVLGAVDQFGFLALLDRLDGQPQLLRDLVVRAGVQVGDPGVDVEQRRDRPQRVLARAGLVVDVGLRQRLVAPGHG